MTPFHINKLLPKQQHYFLHEIMLLFLLIRLTTTNRNAIVQKGDDG